MRPSTAASRLRWWSSSACVLAVSVGLASILQAQEKPFQVVYEVWYRGELVAEEEATYSVNAAKGEAVLKTVSEFSGNGCPTSFKGEACFRLPDLGLVRYHVTCSSRMAAAVFTLKPEGERFVLTATGSVGGHRKEFPRQPNALPLDNNVVAHYQLLAWQWRTGSSEPLVRPVVMPQAGRALQGELVPHGSRQAARGRTTFRARRLRFTAGKLVADLWVREPTRELLKVVLVGQEAEYRQRPEVRWLSEEEGDKQHSP